MKGKGGQPVPPWSVQVFGYLCAPPSAPTPRRSQALRRSDFLAVDSIFFLPKCPFRHFGTILPSAAHWGVRGGDLAKSCPSRPACHKTVCRWASAPPKVAPTSGGTLVLSGPSFFGLGCGPTWLLLSTDSFFFWGACVHQEDCAEWYVATRTLKETGHAVRLRARGSEQKHWTPALPTPQGVKQAATPQAPIITTCIR